MKKTTLIIISHTHWDREWSQTFQQYRYRLVRMMDDLLDNLKKTPDYAVFHLDGQTIPLEDYLEVRPEREEELREQISSGRIVIGPWYVMPDEFLVSGESLIKNLAFGHRIAASYGVSPLRNGYLIDMFGHNSQMPQILNGFQIHSATLYRGIGDYPLDAFIWAAPDGSEVTTAKLDANRSYSNFYFAVRWPYELTGFDPEDAVLRMRQLIDYSKTLAASDMILMMDGVDHIDMEPEIPRMIELFEESFPDVRFEHACLDTYFDRLNTDSLGRIDGALYHLGKQGVNNVLLKNVLSSMVHIKQANDENERLLTYFSEPLNAFTEALGDKLKSFTRNDYSLSPRRGYLEKAWEYLLRNHPHDSMSGCCLSDVHRDNEYRFRQSSQMARTAAKDCLQVITRNIAVSGEHTGSVLLYNPTQNPVDGVTLVDLIVPGSGNIGDLRFYNAQDRILDVQILECRKHTHSDHRIRKLIAFETQYILKSSLELHIPAFGYTTLSYDFASAGYVDYEKKSYAYVNAHTPKKLAGSLMAGHNVIDNGVLEITVQPDGCLDVLNKVTGKKYTRFLTFEDGGDEGEGWNYCKPIFDSVIFGGFACQISVESDGPLAAQLRISRRMHLPADIAADSRSAEEVVQHIDTYVTVLKNSTAIYFRTEIENRVRSHRLRVLFPTNLETDTFYTKLPFDMARWNVCAQDHSEHRETETFVHPNQGITYLEQGRDSIALFNKGLYEVEITDNRDRAIALTLFRAARYETGSSRPEDIQMQRKLVLEYAVDLGCSDPTKALLAGEKYRAGTFTYRFDKNPEAGQLPPSHSFITVEGNGKIVSTVSQNVDTAELPKTATTIRLYDVSGTPETVTVRTPDGVSAAYLVDFLGKIQRDLPVKDGAAEIPCGAHKITTAVLV